MSVALIAMAAMGLWLVQDSNPVSAQRSAGDESSVPTKKMARADMLSIALDLRSASEYSVYAEKGIKNNGSRIKGEAGDALRGGDSAETTRGDLTKAFSAINQLPCQEAGANLRGGSFEPGVYCVSGADLRSTLTLDARSNPNAVFLFRVGGTMRAGAGFELALQNDAQAGNVYFVSDDAIVEENTNFRGNILTAKDITINAGATVTGKTISLDGAVTATEASLAPAAPGVLQICKQTPAGEPTTGEGNLSNRIFRFRIGANIYEVPVGQCSGPITLESGNYTIEELLDGRTIPTGTFNGRFRLVDVNSPTPGALGAVNLPLRTANVFIREGDISNQTIVNFVNTFAITAVIEICKRPVFPSGPNTTPPSTAPINDQDVTGFFDFTVDAIANTPFTVPVGQCSGPIQVNVPTSPGPVPQPATIRVTELAEPGFQLESASTFPASRFISLTLNQGIRNTTACSTIGGGAVPPACLLSPNNNGGGYVTMTVLEGGASNQTTVNFFNRSLPGRVKVCKIAGPGIPEGTRFRFEVRGLAPSNPFPGPQLPGVNVVRFVDVVAGPASQGGFCNFVEGTFIVGSNVLVTELGALDPIPGAPLAAERSASSTTVSAKTEKVNIFDVVKGNIPAARAESTNTANPGTLDSLREQLRGTPESSAPEALTPLVTESGLVSLSVDGLGTTAASGTVQVQKPAGATVRKAFLAAATIPNGTTLTNTDITLNGSPVTFTSTVSNTLSGASDPPLTGVLNNYWGEVTSIVKPTIDAAGAGTVNLTVIENAAKAASIDGVVLAVIFDDPNQTVSNSILLLFGALNPAGETVSVPLTNPINTGAPGYALNMSLGISFSFQGNTNPPLQFSTVDIGTNTRAFARMTSSAGGEDDGEAANGALLTVGGIGDTNANPADPNSTANGNPRQDDELYSLTPFVNNGDTTVNIRTNNPSNDDNIFFGSLFVGANNIGQPVAETISLTPLTAVNPVGTSHTVTAALAAGTNPIPGRQVRFTVLTGPGAGATGNANTAANGQANFTYTNNGTPGTDTIQACFTNSSGAEVCSNIVNKIWVAPVRTTPISRIRSSCGFAPNGTAVQGIPVSPNPNLNTGQVIFPARREVCEVEYTNFIFRPTRLKICKIAGAGVAIGTPFTFDITIDSVGGLFNETVEPVTVQAGPAAQGGFCVFAQGPSQYPLIDTNPAIRSFRVGSIVSVTERATTGIGNPVITSPTGTPGPCSPANPRCATLTLGFPNGFNEITFTNSVSIGTSQQRAPFDFDGDNKSDASVYRNGTWTWTRSSNGGQQSVDFGLATDVTAPADFDGDNKTDVAVFRDGTWHILQSSNGQYKGIQFGQAGDIAQPGDFDGDGSADVAVFRPSTGAWYINRSRDGFFGMQFGIATDRAAAGDYDGDGATDIAVYRPADGAWYIMQSRDGFKAVQFGIASDRIVAADYDGDGRTDPAVYRNGAWYMLRSTAGFGYVQFGVASDRPVPGDYNGDGKADVGVYRDGTWHIMLSGASEATYTSMVLGGGSDSPIPSSYVR